MPAIGYPELKQVAEYRRLRRHVRYLMTEEKREWSYTLPDDGRVFPEHLIGAVWNYLQWTSISVNKGLVDLNERIKKQSLGS